MTQISTAEFRNGMVLQINDALMELVEFQHVKPGKGGAFVRTKLRNVLTGRVLERTYRSGERLEQVRLIQEPYQYLYTDGDFYHFMHPQTFDQIAVSPDVVGEAKQYMKENSEAFLLFHESRPIRVDLPASVELKITYTEPGVQGDRAQGGTKPAQLETGATVQVPLFVNDGEVIRVDTRTGQYLERAGS
jgi:elongation factor P